MLKVFRVPVLSLLLLILVDENNVCVRAVDLVHKVGVHLLLVLDQDFHILQRFDHVDDVELLLYFLPALILHQL